MVGYGWEERVGVRVTVRCWVYQEHDDEDGAARQEEERKIKIGGLGCWGGAARQEEERKTKDCTRDSV